MPWKEIKRKVNISNSDEKAFSVQFKGHYPREQGGIWINKLVLDIMPTNVLSILGENQKRTIT